MNRENQMEQLIESPQFQTRAIKLTPFHDGIHYFDDYPAILKELPEDIMTFLKKTDGIGLGNWSFSGMEGLHAYANQTHVILGGIYLGLGYALCYSYDRKWKEICVLRGASSYPIATYMTWTEALKDLMRHDFGWEFLETDSQFKWTISEDEPDLADNQSGSSPFIFRIPYNGDILGYIRIGGESIESAEVECGSGGIRLPLSPNGFTLFNLPLLPMTRYLHGYNIYLHVTAKTKPKVLIGYRRLHSGEVRRELAASVYSYSYRGKEYLIDEQGILIEIQTTIRNSMSSILPKSLS